MRINVKYLAIQLESIRERINAMGRAGLGRPEVNLLLENVRDMFAVIEDRLEFVSYIFESEGEIIQ